MGYIKKLVPGQVLYSLEKTQMGNTTMSTVSVFRVIVREVHVSPEPPHLPHIKATWNGNSKLEYYGLKSIAKFKDKKPTLIKVGMGRARLAKKDEIEAAKAAGTIRESSDAFYIRETW